MSESSAESILKSGVTFGQWWSFASAIVITVVAAVAILYSYNWSKKYTGQTVGQVVQVTCTMNECYLKVNYMVSDKEYETVIKVPMGAYTTGDKFALDYDPTNPSDAISANSVKWGNWVVFGGLAIVGIAWLWYYITMRSQFAAIATGGMGAFRLLG